MVSLDIGPKPSRRFSSLDYFLIALLMLGTLGLYSQVRQFEYIQFDDPLYVSQNFNVLGGFNSQSFGYIFTAVIASNWTPVIYLTELLTVQFFGGSAAVFHIVCALFHTANVVLLYLFLRSSTGKIGPSAIVAMLWGWHPLRVESVAWVGELRDVECGFFWLLAMLAYAIFRAVPSAVRYGFVVGATALALMSKPMAVTLPFTLLLLSYWPLRADQEALTFAYWKRRLLELLPLFCLSGFTSAVAIKTQVQSGTVGTFSDFPMALRVSNAMVSLIKYISKEFVPIRLGLIYPHPGMLGKGISVSSWITAAIILLVISLLTGAFRKSRPYVLAGWIWFIVTMLPVIGLVQLGQASMADRYSYVPAMGFTIAIVWLIADWNSKKKLAQIVTGSFAFIAVLCVACITYFQIGYWKSNHALMVHSNAVIADDFLAQGSLSMDATMAGNIPDAIRLARSAIELVPTNDEAHHALGLSLQANGQPMPALREYALAIRYNPDDPGVRVDTGRLLAQEKKFDPAIQQFQKAIDLAPGVPDAHHYLAAVLAAQGNYDQAIDQWRIATALNPHFGLAQGLLADALRLRGDRTGAVEHYRLALAAGENNPQWKANLAWEVAIDPTSTSDQLQQLIPVAQQACEQTSQNQAFPLYANSMVVARLGRFDDATDLATIALKIAVATKQTQLANDITLRLEAYRHSSVNASP